MDVENIYTVKLFLVCKVQEGCLLRNVPRFATSLVSSSGIFRDQVQNTLLKIARPTGILFTPEIVSVGGSETTARVNWQERERLLSGSTTSELVGLVGDSVFAKDKEDPFCL